MKRYNNLTSVKRKAAATAMLCLTLLGHAAETEKPLIPVPPPDRHEVQQYSREEIATLIRWIHQPGYPSRCHGYYEELRGQDISHLQVPIGDLPVHIHANVADLEHTGLTAFEAAGDVIITQGNRQFSADHAILHRDPVTLKPESLDLLGNVSLHEPGKLVLSDKAHINLEDESGELSRVVYRMTFARLTVSPKTVLEPEETTPFDKATVRIDSLTAWGIANKFVRHEDGEIDVLKGSYTTCPPSLNTWQIKANTIKLNRATGRGSASNARLYYKDFPILYTPYINFPLDGRRKTGFLFPVIGSSTETGTHFAAPFYWNIAPNYDALITPNYMEDRGLQWNGLFRYMTKHSTGDVHGSVLWNDEEFDKTKRHILSKFPEGTPRRGRLEDTNNHRYFLSWLDDRQLTHSWSSHLYLNHASDDYYFTDFDPDPAQATDNQIFNTAQIQYANTHWTFVTRLLGYQTLHPLDQTPVANQYRILPGMYLNGIYPAGPKGVDLQWHNSFVNFTKKQNPGATLNVVEGGRLNINPSVAFPKYWMWGYINPQMQVAATQYVLTGQPAEFSSDITRLMPIFDIDGGLYFVRELNFSKHRYEQTIEPRLFYLYVPYKDQTDIPLFDTGVQPFSYDQLFRTNRFVGIDRIADANQLSVAITTRFLKKATGDEKFRASLGEIFYFRDRRVILRDAETDHLTRNNLIPVDTPSSPLVALLSYNINKSWRLITDAAWDPNLDRLNNSHFGFQYRKDTQHLINIGYNYLRGGDPEQFEPFTGEAIPILSHRNDLSQADASILWPITSNISGLARWNYNVSHGYTQNAFAGIQYETCCWAVRLIGGREFNFQRRDFNDDTQPIYNRKIYIELVLKGLTSISPNSPHRLLSSSIPGYQETLTPF